MPAVQLVELGSNAPYGTTWDLQKQLFQQKLDQKKAIRNSETDVLPENHLILVQHQPVYTLGKHGNYDNLLVDSKDHGAEFFKIDRGGDITFHGPGQLTGYPILDLEQFTPSLAQYIDNLEQVVIDTLATYGLEGARRSDAPGVWLDAGDPWKQRKICAVGVRSSRWVTMHGFAFNINTDMEWFKKMIPCGIQDGGVTSLHLELGALQDFEQVLKVWKGHFKQRFQCTFEV